MAAHLPAPGHHRGVHRRLLQLYPQAGDQPGGLAGEELLLRLPGPFQAGHPAVAAPGGRDGLLRRRPVGGVELFPGPAGRGGGHRGAGRVRLWRAGLFVLLPLRLPGAGGIRAAGQAGHLHQLPAGGGPAPRHPHPGPAHGAVLRPVLLFERPVLLLGGAVCLFLLLPYLRRFLEVPPAGRGGAGGGERRGPLPDHEETWTL